MKKTALAGMNEDQNGSKFLRNPGRICNASRAGYKLNRNVMLIFYKVSIMFGTLFIKVSQPLSGRRLLGKRQFGTVSRIDSLLQPHAATLIREGRARAERILQSGNSFCLSTRCRVSLVKAGIELVPFSKGCPLSM